jgi:hypothetical protein
MIIESSFGYYIPFEKSLTNTLKSIPPHIDINFNQNNKKFKNDFLMVITLKRNFNQMIIS